MNNFNYTPENITTLKENEIFVFGSNLNGNHSGGAARVAVDNFGAVMEQAEGLRTSGGSAVAYAWYVWEKGYKGNTIVKWIN